MAASSSDESSNAPGNFHISSTSSIEDADVCDGIGLNTATAAAAAATVGAAAIAGVNTGVGVRKNIFLSTAASIKCPLCCTQQRRFHCRNCVKNGHVAPTQTNNGEILLEKQQRYISVQRDLQALSKCYENYVKERKEQENIDFEIKKKREKVKLLQELVAKKRVLLQTHCEKRAALHKANADKRKHLPNYPIKVKDLNNYVLDRVEKTNKLREKNNLLLNRLQEHTRRGILQLVEYIFPISEIVLREEQRKRAVETATAASGKDAPLHSDELQKIAALADAKNTSYIRGKWVFHGSGISEMQYRIVAPSLPANGDYTAYLDWLSDNKDDVPKTTDSGITPSRVAAFRIVGALTYTTQLIQLMSFYLNVRLPHKLAYGDFSKKLNEDEFRCKVTRLNANIMYLAYTQQVKLQALNEEHTLENLLYILDLEKSDLGRHGYHEVSNAPLMKSIDSLLLGLETTTESESEDDNSIRLDWEAVTSLPTQQEIIESNLIAPASQQSTITEGLMTSAAKGITSILRWIK